MARFIKYQARRGFLNPTPETFEGIERAIQWAERDCPRKLPWMMNELVFYMALYNQGVARKMSFGPYDPAQTNTGAAWQIPVRRISNNYYLSWKVRQPRLGVAVLYNDSREAFFIEYGINWRGGGRRIRRPILKLSLKKTLEFLRSTHVYDRVWASIFYDPKNAGKGKGFYQTIQAPAGAYVKGWENVSRRTAQNTLRASRAKTMRAAGIRVHHGRFQRAVYNRGGNAYGKGGAQSGRTAPFGRLPG